MLRSAITLHRMFGRANRRSTHCRAENSVCVCGLNYKPISPLFGILIRRCKLNVKPDTKIRKLNNLRKESARATIGLRSL